MRLRQLRQRCKQGIGQPELSATSRVDYSDESSPRLRCLQKKCVRNFKVISLNLLTCKVEVKFIVPDDGTQDAKMHPVFRVLDV